MFCADGVGIKELLARAIERDAEAALDAETDDEHMDSYVDSQDSCAALPDPYPIEAYSSSTRPAQKTDAVQPIHKRGRAGYVQDPDAPHCVAKHERSLSPALPRKKSKHARKHRKKQCVRAEQRERDGHVPRPKVVEHKIEVGSSVKTAVNSENLPAAHGAYMAKNSSKAGASKAYLPADLDQMGFTKIPWDGL